MDSSSRGFTLIELIIVITIIALIAAALFLAIDPARRISDTQQTQNKIEIKTLDDAIGNYTADTAGLPLEIAGLTSDQYYLISKVKDVPGGATGECPCLGEGVSLVSLHSSLAPNYLATIPIDHDYERASTTNPYASGYYIKRTGNVVAIGACDHATKIANANIGTPSAGDPSWVTGAVNYRIYESNNLAWGGGGTLLCSATLTDGDSDQAQCLWCDGRGNTVLRYEIEVKNTGGQNLTFRGENPSDNIAYTNGLHWYRFGTVDSCRFYDFGGDDGTTQCDSVQNANNVSMWSSGSDVIIKPGEKEGLMYLATMNGDPNCMSLNTYLTITLGGVSEQSSIIPWSL